MRFQLPCPRPPVARCTAKPGDKHQGCVTRAVHFRVQRLGVVITGEKKRFPAHRDRADRSVMHPSFLNLTSSGQPGFTFTNQRTSASSFRVAPTRLAATRTSLSATAATMPKAKRMGVSDCTMNCIWRFPVRVGKSFIASVAIDVRMIRRVRAGVRAGAATNQADGPVENPRQAACATAGTTPAPG